MTPRWERHYPLVAIAAPMTVWAVHFVAVYSLVGLGCERGLFLQRIGTLPLLSWTLVLLTTAALALIAWLGWHAFRRWRTLRTRGVTPGPPPSRESFMRLTTALLALLAFIAVVFTATPVFMLPPCA